MNVSNRKNAFVKVFSVVLTVCMLLTNAMVFSVGAEDTDATMTYTVNGEYAECGKKLIVTINVENNPGLWSSITFLKFNPEALSLNYDPDYEPEEETDPPSAITNGNMWSIKKAAVDFGVTGDNHPYEWAHNSVYLSYTGNKEENASTKAGGTLVTIIFDVVDPAKAPGFELKTWCTDKNYYYEADNHAAYDPETKTLVGVPFNVAYDVPELSAPVYGHTAKVVEGYAPTCEETGLTDKLVCEVCDEVIADHTVIEATGHTEVEIPAVAPTCEETGLTAGMECTVCGKVTVEQKVVEATGHTEEDLSAVEPTCEETGLTAGKKCTVCEKITLEQEIVGALGHSEEVLPAVEATCEATGLTEGKKCTVCEKITVEQQEIELQSCVPADENEWIVEKEATETEDGLMYQTCKWCEKRINETVLPSLDTIFTVTVVDVHKTYVLEHKAGDVVEIAVNQLVGIEATGKGYVFESWTVEGADEYGQAVNGYAIMFDMPANNVTVTVNRFVHGNVNGDDKITAADTLAFLKSLKSGEFTLATDVNMDGKVTAADKLALNAIVKGTYDYSPYFDEE